MFNGGMGGNAGYAIAIERVSRDEVNRLARQFGLNTNAGLSIIR